MHIVAQRLISCQLSCIISTIFLTPGKWSIVYLYLMTIQPSNNSPFLRTSRKFPQDAQALETELSKMYIDVANQVNSRDIALYLAGQTNTGQLWGTPSNGQGQQALRQVFAIPATLAGATSTITHNIASISQVTRLYGVVTTATPDYRPLPYASTTANANIEIKASSTTITIIVGAASPNVSSGSVVIEWLP